jgi:hypothetical protein
MTYVLYDETANKLNSIPRCACEICGSGYIAGKSGSVAASHLYRVISLHMSPRLTMMAQIDDMIYGTARRLVRQLEEELDD